MNFPGGSGGDDFFGGGGDFFGGGGMGGPMGAGGMGRDGPMGNMGGGHPRQGGYSSFSSYDSARLEGQQYQEFYEPFGDYARGGSGGVRGFMFSGLTRADNPFRHQVGQNPAGGYNPSAQEEPRYQHTGRGNPQHASRYEEYPRCQGGGHSGRQPYRQPTYYEDGSCLEDEGARSRQSYAPQQAYGGGGARRSGGGSGGGRLFNYDRFGRRN